MRCAFLADIHSNLSAFEAVLNDLAGSGGAQEVICLGDIVGYGPDPRECIRLVQSACSCCVAGNHDWAAAGKTAVTEFNRDAGAAALWTGRQLNEAEIDYLGNLPPRLEKYGFTLVHGSPHNPIWEYLLTAQTAEESLPYFKTGHCLVGHSHLPLLFESTIESASSPEKRQPLVMHALQAEEVVTLAGKRLIINPGSVGQPRDGDARASYALYDATTGTFTLRRVAYDIKAVQRRISAAGLPEWLSERLALGK